MLSDQQDMGDAEEEEEQDEEKEEETEERDEEVWFTLTWEGTISLNFSEITLDHTVWQYLLNSC